MATLVLTAVGNALGGTLGAVGAAVGGAAGALAGRSIDGLIFRPGGRTGPRLSDLQVQTSRYGAPIPRLHGTIRVAGTVIWATDLKERPIDQRRRQGEAERDHLQLFGEHCGGAVFSHHCRHRPDLGGRQSVARGGGRLQIADGRIPAAHGWRGSGG